MTTASKRKLKLAPILEEEYRSALIEYVQGGGESSLGRAYELGRRAISEKRGLLEIASLHHEALRAILTDTQGAARRRQILAASAEFLTEILSPYEMAHRG